MFSVRNSFFINIIVFLFNEFFVFFFIGCVVGVRGVFVYNVNIFMSGMDEILYFENCDYVVDIE